MNKNSVYIIIFFLLSSCIGKYNSDVQKATVKEKGTLVDNTSFGDTVKIKLSKSKINWKGTKMRGAGKHEGKIELKSGYLITRNQKLINGKFVADMNSLGVTDIPSHEPIPIKNLNNHLKSSAFFDVNRYPTSKFEITVVRHITSDSLILSGNLTIKEITNTIEFGALYNKKELTAKFTIDRFKWDIAYKGSITDKTLVDKDIELNIVVLTN